MTGPLSSEHHPANSSSNGTNSRHEAHHRQVQPKLQPHANREALSSSDGGDDRSFKSCGSTHSHSKYSKKSAVSSIGQGHPNTDDDKSDTSSIGSMGGHTHGTGGSLTGGTSGSNAGGGGGSLSRSERSRGNNPKILGHSSSIIGLDSMIENRREEGDLTANVVHMEVPVS